VGTAAGSAVFRFWGASNIQLSHLRIRSGADGIVFENGARDCSLIDVRVESNAVSGIRVTGITTSVSVTGLVAFGQGGAGLTVEAGSVDIQNATIFGQVTNGVRIAGGSLSMSNSIVVARNLGSHCVRIESGTYVGDYNNLYHSEFVSLGWISSTGEVSTVSEWQAATGQDAHSLSDDPLLYSEGARDAHLPAGRLLSMGFIVPR
jgi:hypothetical protein